MIPIEVDPPDHTAFRQALQPLFSPGRTKELEVEIRNVITTLFAGFAGRGEAELISEVAHEPPARMDPQVGLWGYFSDVIEQHRASGSWPTTSSATCSSLLLFAGLHTVQGSLSWGVTHPASRVDQRQLEGVESLRTLVPHLQVVDLEHAAHTAAVDDNRGFTEAVLPVVATHNGQLP